MREANMVKADNKKLGRHRKHQTASNDSLAKKAGLLNPAHRPETMAPITIKGEKRLRVS
jgi:hypothetical protein